MPHFVYRQFDADGKLLYVGTTSNVKKRMIEHGASPWMSRVHRFTVEEFPDREKALYAEKLAVMNERPECNTVWRPNLAEDGEAMTVAQRKAKERKAKRDAGLVPVEIWVPASKVAAIKAIAAQMVAELPKVIATP
jgi:predicted GIY-YIG superfamily endonuclease